MARRKVPSAAEAKLMADAEARRLAAAAQQRTRDKERALALVLAEIARRRRSPTRRRADGRKNFVKILAKMSRSKYLKALAPTEKVKGNVSSSLFEEEGR